ncbi:Prostamide/prostaglandin F synthase [Thelohanellus kitauei]|uniref:Prostamide/prostaglandin F synthase n=1 Tax=Thelohanellus kitauei TaxID=669202 RepID=A0A0C2M8B3_THEKT|nr:Prostamide/prostaglandin F synthase [Thelohanellus kitauei]
MNVQLVAVGFDTMGMEEFINEKFFNGNLYIDTSKQTYKLLGFKTSSHMEALGDMFSSLSWKDLNDSLAENLRGDVAGDLSQNGGTVCLSADGQVLFKYVQEMFSDRPNLQEILNLFDKKTDQ